VIISNYSLFDLINQQRKFIKNDSKLNIKLIKIE